MKGESGAGQGRGPAGAGLADYTADQEQLARPCLANDASLSRFLERWVDQQTCGRIHCLEVERQGETIIIRGWARSYCVRLRAANAIREALSALQEAAGDVAGEPRIVAFKVENRIVVTSSY